MDIDSQETLLTIAEVAIAIAGFSGLATIVAMSTSDNQKKIETYRFQGMLINSLLVVFFAFVPILIASFGVGDLDMWRLSSCVFVALIGSRFAIVTLNTMRFWKHGAKKSRAFYPINLLMCITVAVPTVNIVYSLPKLANGLYLFGLLGLLAISGSLFLVVFFAWIESTEDEK